MSIAVQWVVFAELSTDAMIATGMTDKPSEARWDTAQQRPPWGLREAARAAGPAGPVSFPG
jgi:hypothetical protein